MMVMIMKKVFDIFVFVKVDKFMDILRIKEVVWYYNYKYYDGAE